MASNGKIPHRWERTTIGDIADVVGGSTPSKAVAQYWNGNIPWATPTDITALRSRYISATETNITKEGLDKSGTRLLPEHSVLMTSRATIGYCAINTCPMATNQGFASLIPKGDLLTEFLYYHLTSRRSELERLSSGSTFLELGKAHLKGLQVLLPPKDVQGRIVNILNSVDEAIEATRAVIDQTRRLKTALLQDLLTNGLPGRHKKFNRRKWLGRFPADWCVANLEDVCTKITDGVHQSVKTQDAGVPFLYVSSVRDNRIEWDGCAHISEQTYAEISKGREPLKGAVLYTVVGSYGHAAVLSEYRHFSFQRHIAYLVPDHNRITSDYLGLWLNSDVNKRTADRIALGNAQKTITLGELSKMPLLLPTIDEQKAICVLTNQIDRRLAAATEQELQLSRLKSALSQGLLTGRIPVKGAE